MGTIEYKKSGVYIRSCDQFIFTLGEKADKEGKTKYYANFINSQTEEWEHMEFDTIEDLEFYINDIHWYQLARNDI